MVFTFRCIDCLLNLQDAAVRAASAAEELPLVKWRGKWQQDEDWAVSIDMVAILHKLKSNFV
jgi:hypothetical protein